MRTNAGLFWILAAFFYVAAALYTVWSIIDHNAGEVLYATQATSGVEWIGTVAITLSGVLATFLAFYITITQRATGGTLPEDRLEAVVDDGDPEIGHFSPWSWWPFVLAFSLGLMFLGFAVGIWITFIGAPLVIIAVIGWNYEYYRGNFAR